MRMKVLSLLLFGSTESAIVNAFLCELIFTSVCGRLCKRNEKVCVCVLVLERENTHPQRDTPLVIIVIITFDTGGGINKPTLRITIITTIDLTEME